MPLWALPFRTLARRHPPRYIIHQPKTAIQWHRPRRLDRSYTTALRANQPDDTLIPPAAPSVEHSSASTSTHLSSASYDHRLANTQHSNGFRRRRDRRLLALKRARTPNALSSLDRKAQKRITSRAILRVLRRKRRVLLPTPRMNLAHFRVQNPLPNWREQINRLGRYYVADEIQRKALCTPLLPTLDVRAFEWVEFVIDRLDNGQQNLIWEDLPFANAKDPIWVWQQVALWLLAFDQQKMIRFLLATHVQPYIPQDLIVASLRHLANYFKNSDNPKDAFHIQRLADAFCVLADRGGTQPLYFNGSFFRKLMPYCSDEQIHRMFAAVNAHNVQVPSSFTWLHFSSYFAKRGHFIKALDSLLEAHKHGIGLNSLAFRMTCSTVLRKSSEETDGLRVCLRVVSTLVDIGVKLDGPICDIIMLNAVDAGDLKTAFSVYHSLMERGLQPRESTFIILLQGCKLNIDDVDLLNEIIRDAIGNINVRKNVIVATQIMHCLALHHSMHNPQTVLNTLTEAYAQLFGLQPLQKLRLPMPNVSQHHPASEELMAPSRHAMTFMIGASIQQTLSHNASPKEVLPLYERWRELVEAGDPLHADLATTDHLANVFLMAFIRTPKGLLHAARVVRDMQRPLPPSAGVQQCKPTVQTWSIFLHGFTRHRQMKLGEQVLNYMRSKGIEPNSVTWNTLMTGYARAQDVDGTLGTLRLMEASGMVWDVWTHGGMKALKDRRRLEEEYEKRRLTQSLDFTDDLKQGLGKRLSGAPEEGESPPVPAEAAGPAAYQKSDDRTGESNLVDGFGDSPGDIAEQGAYRPFG